MGIRGGEASWASRKGPQMIDNGLSTRRRYRALLDAVHRCLRLIGMRKGEFLRVIQESGVSAPTTGCPSLIPGFRS